MQQESGIEGRVAAPHGERSRNDRKKLCLPHVRKSIPAERIFSQTYKNTRIQLRSAACGYDYRIGQSKCVLIPFEEEVAGERARKTTLRLNDLRNRMDFLTA